MNYNVQDFLVQALNIDPNEILWFGPSMVRFSKFGHSATMMENLDCGAGSWRIAELSPYTGEIRDYVDFVELANSAAEEFAG